jgi:serine/threonine-protein kinase
LSEALALGGEAAYHVDRSADGEKLLEEAELAAEAGGDDDLRFDCEVSLVRVVGYALERDADGERHALRAEAMLTRLGADRRRTGTLAWSRSLARWWNGHYAEARVQAQAAVDAFTQVDPAGVDLARALHMRAIVEQELHEPSASIATEQRARAIGERALGAQHPLIGQMWNTTGGSLRRLGKFDDAIAALQRGLDITDATDGPDSSEAGAALMNIANVYLDEDRAPDALPLLERGLAIWEKVYGPDHSRVADLLDNLGGAYSKTGRDADATAALTRAIAIHKARLGPDAPATASSWKQLGYHQQRMHRYADARAAFTEAVRAIDASQGPHSPLAVAPLVGLGDVEHLLGHRAAAAAAYARALALMPADEPDLRAEATAKLAAVRAP